jgi:hypothetical protein
MSAISTPLPWGHGDLYTLIIAIGFFVVGCMINWRALRAHGTDCTDLVGGIMGSGLTAGPMVMILVDPLNKAYGFLRVDLLGTVMNEARVTLWFACFLALLNTVVALLRLRE